MPHLQVEDLMTKLMQKNEELMDRQTKWIEVTEDRRKKEEALRVKDDVYVHVKDGMMWWWVYTVRCVIITVVFFFSSLLSLLASFSPPLLLFLLPFLYSVISLPPISIRHLENDREKLTKENSRSKHELQELNSAHLSLKDENLANLAALNSNEQKLKKLTQENDQLVKTDTKMCTLIVEPALRQLWVWSEWNLSYL